MTTTTTTTYEGRTAEEWREQARASRKRSADSFERCDTDGFMSQWASDLTAREYELKAELAETGAWTYARALFDAETGEVASTHVADGQWGLYWVLNDAATAKYGKRFLNESKAATSEKRAAAMRKKGFTVGKVKVAAYVAMTGGSITSVAPRILASVDALKAGEYEVVTTDVGPDSIWY